MFFLTRNRLFRATAFYAWSRITKYIYHYVPNLPSVRDLVSAVSGSREEPETCLRLTKLKNEQQCSFFLTLCAPARNRTSNNGLEVRSYIHLTTGAKNSPGNCLLSAILT